MSILEREEQMRTYVDDPFDVENAAEMARLMRQGRLVSAHLGVLPASMEIKSHPKRVLDLACGPGEWVLSLAQAHPDWEIWGVDESGLVLSYARSLAREHDLQNVHFRQADVTDRPPFPDGTFDLVHLRFAASFLTTEGWLPVLREVWRLLRAGGTIISLEMENLGTSKSVSFTGFQHLFAQAMHARGQGWPRQHGITDIQARRLELAGYQQVASEAVSLDVSAGTSAYQEWSDNLLIAIHLAQPFLVESGLISRQDMEILCQRASEEIRHPDFQARVTFHRAWAIKPNSPSYSMMETSDKEKSTTRDDSDPLSGFPSALMALSDPRWEVRAEGIQTLAALFKQFVIKPLLAALSDPDFRVRGAALHAVGLFTSCLSREALFSLARDPSLDWITRDAAVTVLERDATNEITRQLRFSLNRELEAEEEPGDPEGQLTISPLSQQCVSEEVQRFGLTRREMDVLRLLAQGLRNREIAERLRLSVVTINSYLRSVYTKLGVNTRTAAMREALDHGLLE